MQCRPAADSDLFRERYLLPAFMFVPSAAFENVSIRIASMVVFGPCFTAQPFPC
jgi:hypothetical protein